ncbi:metallophosphoesterase [Candidatus Woesearchaeota archaeon]|nr:metallophosphoesterase [Candidatus Woesearchaeota archaeon]
MKIDEKELDGLLKKAERDPKKIKAEVLQLLEKNVGKKPLDLLELCNLSGLSPRNATSLYQLIVDQLPEEQQKKAQLITGTLEPLALGEREFEKIKNGYKLTIDPKYTFRVVLVSDTHLGSTYDNIEGLEEMYDRAISIGAKTVLHSGDLVHGAFKHDLFLNLRPGCNSFNGQRDYVVDHWPQRDGVATFLIAGNHDQFFRQQNDADICSEIALRRPDIVYLKDQALNEVRREGKEKGLSKEALQKILEVKKIDSGRSGALRLGPSHLSPEKRNTIHMMVHPGDGSARTLSYKPQQILANIETLLYSFENMVNPEGKRIKPHLLQIGHYHKGDLALLRGVYTFQAGTMTAADEFHENKNLMNMMGYWIVEMTTKKNGDIVALESHFQKPYVPPEKSPRRVILGR